MPYNLPPLAVTGDIIPASWGNAVRDTLLASAIGIATTAGQIPYATGANALAMLNASGTAGAMLYVEAGLPAWNANVVATSAGALALAAGLTATTGTFSGAVTGGTYNGQTISAVANFTGNLTVAAAFQVNGAAVLKTLSMTNASATDAVIRLATTGSVGFYDFEPTDAYLEIQGNNTAALRISTAGAVTIPTNLTVSGSVRSDTYNNAANTANMILRSASTTVVGNGSLLLVNDSGSVQIGGVSIASKLHLEGAANAKTSQLSITGTGVASIGIRPTTVGMAFLTDTAGFSWRTGATISTDGNTGTERMSLSSGSELSVNGGGNTAFRLSGGAGSLGRFIANDGADAGYIDYDHSVDAWIFRTAGAEHFRIASTGQVTFTPASGSQPWTTADMGTAINYATFTNTGGTFATGVDNSAGAVSGRAYAALYWHTGSRSIAFGTAGSLKWEITSAGHLVAGSGNAYKIGNSQADAPSYVHAYQSMVSNNFQINGSGAGTAQGVLADWTPNANGVWSLGNTSFRWLDVWCTRGAFNGSSRAFKTGERPLDRAAMLALARRTDIVAFKYKTPEGRSRLERDDPGADFEHVGFIAEDVDVLLSPDRTHANAQTTASVALAAVAGEADAREATDAALRSDLARLEREVEQLRRELQNRRN